MCISAYLHTHNSTADREKRGVAQRGGKQKKSNTRGDIRDPTRSRGAEPEWMDDGEYADFDFSSAKLDRAADQQMIADIKGLPRQEQRDDYFKGKGDTRAERLQKLKKKQKVSASGPTVHKDNLSLPPVVTQEETQEAMSKFASRFGWNLTVSPTKEKANEFSPKREAEDHPKQEKHSQAPNDAEKSSSSISSRWGFRLEDDKFGDRSSPPPPSTSPAQRVDLNALLMMAGNSKALPPMPTGAVPPQNARAKGRQASSLSSSEDNNLALGDRDLDIDLKRLVRQARQRRESPSLQSRAAPRTQPQARRPSGYSGSPDRPTPAPGYSSLHSNQPSQHLNYSSGHHRYSSHTPYMGYPSTQRSNMPQGYYNGDNDGGSVGPSAGYHMQIRQQRSHGRDESRGRDEGGPINLNKWFGSSDSFNAQSLPPMPQSAVSQEDFLSQYKNR